MTKLYPDQIEAFLENFGYAPKNKEDAIEFLKRNYPGFSGEISAFLPMEEAMPPFFNQYGDEE